MNHVQLCPLCSLYGNTDKRETCVLHACSRFVTLVCRFGQNLRLYDRMAYTCAVRDRVVRDAVEVDAAMVRDETSSLYT